MPTCIQAQAKQRLQYVFGNRVFFIADKKTAVGVVEGNMDEAKELVSRERERER